MPATLDSVMEKQRRERELSNALQENEASLQTMQTIFAAMFKPGQDKAESEEAE